MRGGLDACMALGAGSRRLWRRVLRGSGLGNSDVSSVPLWSVVCGLCSVVELYFLRGKMGLGHGWARGTPDAVVERWVFGAFGELRAEVTLMGIRYHYGGFTYCR
jgi:hypothetical protein